MWTNRGQRPASIQKLCLSIWGLISIVGLLGCGNNDGTIIRMTSRERAVVDTLYARQIKELREGWDSTCTAHFDSLVAIAVDSIILVRRQEELRLRARRLENEQ